MTAEQIMQKQSLIKDEMDRQLPKAQSDALWEQATKKLNAVLQQYADLPKGIHPHTDSYIFPTAAIYLTAKEAIGVETAYQILEDAAIRNCDAMGKKVQRIMRLPGMASLFLKIWDPLTKTMFGAGNGFTNRFYPSKKGEHRMDILSCPYYRYYTELGCPELTKISCENDDRIYGNLPGLVFERNGTLGKGADRCDFCIRRV